MAPNMAAPDTPDFAKRESEDLSSTARPATMRPPTSIPTSVNRRASADPTAPLWTRAWNARRQNDHHGNGRAVAGSEQQWDDVVGSHRCDHTNGDAQDRDQLHGASRHGPESLRTLAEGGHQPGKMRRGDEGGKEHQCCEQFRRGPIPADDLRARHQSKNHGVDPEVDH